MEQLFIDAVGNIGVPAVLAFYVLFRVNVTLEELTKAVNSLSTKMERRL